MAHRFSNLDGHGGHVRQVELRVHLDRTAAIDDQVLVRVRDAQLTGIEVADADRRTAGLDVSQIIETKRKKSGVASMGGTQMDPVKLAASSEADIFVELTLTNLKDGQPGLDAKVVSDGQVAEQTPFVSVLRVEVELHRGVEP